MTISVLGQDESGPSVSRSWEEGEGMTEISDEAARVSPQAKIGAGPI